MLLFDAGVPQWVPLALFAIITVTITYLYVTRKDWPSFFKNSSMSLLLGYIVFVICATLLFREESENIRFYIHPFWSYHVLYYRMIAEIVLNVLMFVPIGFLMGAVLKKKSFFLVLCAGCLLSVAIETTQLLTKRGVCNIDDVIHNTVGCAIGFACFVLFYRLIRRIA